MMIQAVLSNPHHPEYGVATIPFPIPHDQYAHCMELLEALEIGDAIKADCKVEELGSFFSVLKCVEMHPVNVEELNYLAKRLESFDSGEAAQFQAMAHKLGLSTCKDFINLTFCCQRSTAITDFSDLAAIGREHYMNLHGGSAGVDELKALDTEDGMFTDRGYIAYKGGIVLKEVMECSQGEQPAPEPWRGESRDEMLRMTLYAKNKSGYLLVLPADEEYLSAAKSCLGVEDFAEAEIRDVRFKVPYIGGLMRTLDCPSVEEYNGFAKAMESIWQKDGALLTYAAVLDADRPDTLGRAYELLQNLENYERIVKGTYGYGQQRLQEKLGLDDAAVEMLDGYMDFEKYGEECMEADGVITTEFGLLRRLEPPFAAHALQMRGMV